jgi:hypothetical protein
MTGTFEHSHAAHCESGVMAALARHHGVPLSEPMAFGLASALSFAYLPFIRISGQPLIAYRMPPKSIVKGLQDPLRLAMRFETFRDPAHGMARLDELLARGQVIGLQTSVYWLPYFPADLRFHFNAHNLLVYGRDGDDYLISDPVFETPVRCARADLQRARFARGMLAPKGLLYFRPDGTGQPLSGDWHTFIPAAIRKTSRIMRSPIPWIGVHGMRRLARVMRSLADKETQRASLFIGHVVRMQEEIGTGGAGFRFMYASFLQESAALIGRPALEDLAAQLMDIGDRWREFALAAARMCRGRDRLDTPALAVLVEQQAQSEQVFFDALRRAV